MNNRNLSLITQKGIAAIATTLLLAVLILIAALWSWNTIAELFGGPTAQLKHVLAAVILVAIVSRTFVWGSRVHQHPRHLARRSIK